MLNLDYDIKDLWGMSMKKIAIMTSVLILSLGLFACSKEEVPEIPVETPVEIPVEEPEEEPVAEAEEEVVSEGLHRYETPQPGLSPLTGLPYEGDGKVIMVQMENTSAARPHSGLAEADLIYEMEVESTITRLTTFFHGTYPEKVGPIRSTRKQHMFLWKEWNYLYIYFGGSRFNPGQNIDEWREDLGITADSLDGTRTSKSFSRSTDREAPHNAYSNLDMVMNEAYEFEPVDRTLYYDDEAGIGGEMAKKVSLAYRSDNKITYSYDEENKVYLRSINGEPMMDKETNKQIAVKNIIVQHAHHFDVTDTVYTNIDLIGSGDAEYFIDGVMKKGNWERVDENSMTRYLDEDGQEIPFKPGKTFIQIMRNDSEVTFE